MNNRIATYTNYGLTQVHLDGRHVGSHDNMTYKTIRRDFDGDGKPIHFYLKGGGYPISVAVLTYLKEKNIKNILIVEYCTKSGKVNKYLTTPEEYLLGQVFEHNGDTQACRNLKHLHKSNDKIKQDTLV